MVTSGTQRTYKPLTISSTYQVNSTKMANNNNLVMIIQWRTLVQQVQLEHINQMHLRNDWGPLRTIVTSSTIETYELHIVSRKYEVVVIVMRILGTTITFGTSRTQ